MTSSGVAPGMLQQHEQTHKKSADASSPVVSSLLLLCQLVYFVDCLEMLPYNSLQLRRNSNAIAASICEQARICLMSRTTTATGQAQQQPGASVTTHKFTDKPLYSFLSTDS
jgi:hypothetical protein